MTTTPQAALLRIRRAAEDAINAANPRFGPFIDAVADPLAIIALCDLAKLQATQEPVQTTDPWDHDFIAGRLPRRPMAPVEPVQAGELPEPDGVFYCSEDTGYLTQYRRPPANLTDGDVAMYEADTVRSLLQAALSARKP